MARLKIAISIDETILHKLNAIQRLEKRNSLSNTIESLLSIELYRFLEITDKESDIRFIAEKI